MLHLLSKKRGDVAQAADQGSKAQVFFPHLDLSGHGIWAEEAGTGYFCQFRRFIRQLDHQDGICVICIK